MYVLISTVVAPTFDTQKITITRLNATEFIHKLRYVDRNFCGHPVTNSVLRKHVPELPAAQRGKFWDGRGVALAARPRGGVRNAKGSNSDGDTHVTLNDLEFCEYTITT